MENPNQISSPISIIGQKIIKSWLTKIKPQIFLLSPKVHLDNQTWNDDWDKGWTQDWSNETGPWDQDWDKDWDRN